MILKSLDHLNKISKSISKKLENGDCIFLIGEIGVGKTTFTRFLINNLQNQKTVKIIEWPDLIKTPLINKLEIHLEYRENDKERKMKIYGLSKWKDVKNEI